MELFRCCPYFSMLQSSQSANTRVLRLKSAFICSCCSHVSGSSPWKCWHFQSLCVLFTIFFPLIYHLPFTSIYQVWGEAGNIRFMQGSSEKETAQLGFLELEKMRPEVVCFLTELALASEDVQMGGQNSWGIFLGG